MVANFRPQPERRDEPGNSRDGKNAGWGRDEVTIVLEESQRSVPAALSSRWKRPVAKVVAFEDPLAGLAPLIASSPSRSIILASLSSVCVLDSPALVALAENVGSRIVKLSVGRTPVEIYVAGRDSLARLLQSTLERRSGRKALREWLFSEALVQSMDLLEEVPGEVLFQNDLMEYYQRNLWLLENCASDKFLAVTSRLPELSDKGAESHIGEKGCARNCWLASGVEIDGEVEDSVLFPNVQIKRDAFVSRSIVLNGNRIGSGGVIHNSLVFPFSADLPRAAPNIGDNCSIGSHSSIMKNSDFPDQIRDGLTVIGVDAEIPEGLRVEAGACIGPGVPASVLRKLKIVKKGSCVFRPLSQEPRDKETMGKGRR